MAAAAAWRRCSGGSGCGVQCREAGPMQQRHCAESIWQKLGGVWRLGQLGGNTVAAVLAVAVASDAGRWGGHNDDNVGN